MQMDHGGFWIDTRRKWGQERERSHDRRYDGDDDVVDVDDA